ncbi:hypothetical protein V8C86DRAFT_72544 [Haematococcus lacustris]
MTEAWRSNAMHWCDVCKCWLNDTKAAKAHHEQGMGHKANLARKLRDMARKAEDEKRQKVQVANSLSRIEEQAQAKFQEDKKSAAAAAAAEVAAAEARSGVWVWDPTCSYYYNEPHRWYYDPQTQWYYGGEPDPEWSQAPPIPDYALFGTARHEGGPLPQPAPTAPDSKPAASRAQSSAATGPEGVTTTTITRVIALPSHPLAGVGGHATPSMGRVGAAKQTGRQDGSQPAHTAALAGDKRKREAGDGGSGAAPQVSAAEAAALAKREAARQRVAQRTAQNFGFV